MAGKNKKKQTKTTPAKKVPEKAVPPTSTSDPNNKIPRRKSTDIISTFRGHLDQTEDQHVQEQMRTLGKIRLLRKDNERIQRKQEAECGMTLDTLEELKLNLDKTRTANQKLYVDMEESKALHDKLEEELKTTKKKYNEMEAVCEDLKKQTKVWEETKVNFTKSEERERGLREANKRLRFILLNNHIDHKADANSLTTKDTTTEDSYSLKSNRTFPRMSNRHLTVKGRYQLAGEIDKIRKLDTNEMKRKYGLKPANLDQVNPAYLGFYLKRKRKSVLHLEPLTNPPNDIQYHFYRAGLTLPKINARRYDRLTLD